MAPTRLWRRAIIAVASFGWSQKPVSAGTVMRLPAIWIVGHCFGKIQCAIDERVPWRET